MPQDRNQNQNQSGQDDRSGRGDMSVREAGHLGGEKGGQRVRELIEEGKQAERKGGNSERGSDR